MRNIDKVRERMSVIDYRGNPVGTVGRIEGTRLMLTPHGSEPDGDPHWVAMAWVASVDQAVRLNKGCDQVVQEWKLPSMTIGA